MNNTLKQSKMNNSEDTTGQRHLKVSFVLQEKLFFVLHCVNLSHYVAQTGFKVIVPGVCCSMSSFGVTFCLLIWKAQECLIHVDLM